MKSHKPATIPAKRKTTNWAPTLGIKFKRERQGKNKNRKRCLITSKIIPECCKSLFNQLLFMLISRNRSNNKDSIKLRGFLLYIYIIIYPGSGGCQRVQIFGFKGLRRFSLQCSNFIRSQCPIRSSRVLCQW